MEKELVIGMGQCGGNLSEELDKKGINVMAINTSKEDLDPLKIDDRKKAHLPTSRGCSKNRKIALDEIKRHFPFILSSIETRYPLQDNVLVAFSAGGGTGGGSSPVLIDIMMDEWDKKNFSCVLALPSTTDSLQAKFNAVECYRELSQISMLKNLFVLNNLNQNIICI